MKSVAPPSQASSSNTRLLRRWGKLELRSRGGQLELYGNLDGLAQLDRVARCHCVGHPLLPRLVGREETALGASLLFGADVYCDFETLVADLEQGEHKVPYAGALSLGEQLAEGLQRWRRQDILRERWAGATSLRLPTEIWCCSLVRPPSWIRRSRFYGPQS